MKYGTNAQAVFSGDCVDVGRKGNRVNAKGRMGGGIFEAQLPGLIKGPMCNYLHTPPGDGTHLISHGCTGPDNVMKRVNWKCTGLVIAPVSSAAPYTLKLNTFTGVGANAAAAIAAGAVFSNWFALGIVEWGEGAAIQRRFIVGSTVPVAGAIDLKLQRYFSALPNVGATITFYPGCDGLASTCRAWHAADNTTGKFNNFLNFGGEEQTPIGNPSTTGQRNLEQRGGKK